MPTVALTRQEYNDARVRAAVLATKQLWRQALAHAIYGRSPRMKFGLR